MNGCHGCRALGRRGALGERLVGVGVDKAGRDGGGELGGVQRAREVEALEELGREVERIRG